MYADLSETALDQELVLQIMQGCKSSALRRKKIELGDEAKFDKVLALGARREQAEAKLKSIENGGKEGAAYAGSSKTCKNCGLEWPHVRGCPTSDTICHNCSESGHFSR